MGNIYKNAPVIIPTCNRVNHLKRCLESLSNCKGFKSTEIYISVDYPPNKNFIEGYQNVSSYLNAIKKLYGNITIFWQKSNLGPVSNIDFLVDVVSEKYKFWIFTEDDNDFSSDFLEYMNWGLEKFENDNRVFAICGFKNCNINFETKNTYLANFFQPYGVGYWKEKYTKLREDKELIILNKENYNVRNMINMFRYKKYVFHIFVTEILCNNRAIVWKDTKTLNMVDAVIQIYLYYKKYVCVFPEKYKSRTWGNDGTGCTMAKIENFNPLDIWKLDIDSEYDCDFVFKDFGYINKQEDKSYEKNNRVLLLKDWIKYILFVLCSKDRFKYRKFRESFLYTLNKPRD